MSNRKEWAPMGTEPKDGSYFLISNRGKDISPGFIRPGQIGLARYVRVADGVRMETNREFSGTPEQWCAIPLPEFGTAGEQKL